MLNFFFFMLILLGFIAGSSFVYVLTTRLTRRFDRGPDQPVDTLLREEVESLVARVNRVEDELEFYKRLAAPQESSDSSRAGEGGETAP